MNSVGTIFFGAFAFGIGFDLATTAWWDAHNKGVSFDLLSSAQLGAMTMDLYCILTAVRTSAMLARKRCSPSILGALAGHMDAFTTGSLTVLPLLLFIFRPITLHFQPQQKQWKDIRAKYLEDSE